MNITDITVSLDELLVDPNNYRLDDGSNNDFVSDDKIKDLQKNILEKLKFQRLGELRESILKHGFLEMDRIVVRELENFSSVNKYYVVVEGNRRTAALKSLLNMHRDETMSVPNEIIEKCKSLSVMCIKGSKDEINRFSSTLMGIRHVSGPKSWSGYQSAKLINDEYSSGRSFTEIGALLSISAKDAARRYRGYRAFKQMIDSGHAPKSNYYTLMLEFLAPNKPGRSWLEWNDKEMLFKNEKNREILYLALTGAGQLKPQVTSPSSARDFLQCLESPAHKEKIENGVPLDEVLTLPFSEEAKKIIAVLTNFSNFLQTVQASELSQDEASWMRKINQLIQEKIGLQSND